VAWPHSAVEVRSVWGGRRLKRGPVGVQGRSGSGGLSGVPGVLAARPTGRRADGAGCGLWGPGVRGSGVGGIPGVRGSGAGGIPGGRGSGAGGIPGVRGSGAGPFPGGRGEGIVLGRHSPGDGIIWGEILLPPLIIHPPQLPPKNLFAR
jgi:hypothetical protein